MIEIFVLVSALSGLPAQLSREAELSARHRTPILLMVLATQAESESIRRRLLGNVVDALRTQTAFEASILEEKIAFDCEGRLACLANDPSVRDSAARWMLVLTLLGDTSNDARVNLALVDLVRAQEASLGDAGLAEESLVFRKIGMPATDVNALIREVRDPLTGVIGPSAFRRLGVVQITSRLPGNTEVLLDNQLLGTRSSTTITIVDLLPGQYALTLKRENTSWHSAFSLGDGERIRVHAEFAELERETSHPLRAASLWSGAALMAGGATLLAIAALREDPPSTFCLSDAPCSTRSTFDPLSRAGDAQLFARGARGGVLLAPLGIAVFASGAAWAIGSRFEPEPEDAPWLSIAGGAALGIASYAALSLINDIRR